MRLMFLVLVVVMMIAVVVPCAATVPISPHYNGLIAAMGHTRAELDALLTNPSVANDFDNRYQQTFLKDSQQDPKYVFWYGGTDPMAAAIIELLGCQLPNGNFRPIR